MNNKETFALLTEIKNVLDFDITEANNIGISDLSHHLENKGLINFTIEYRENANGADVWLQAEYWPEKINCPIIVDYDFPNWFDDINNFIYALEDVQNKIDKINSIIN